MYECKYSYHFRIFVLYNENNYQIIESEAYLQKLISNWDPLKGNTKESSQDF